jgi:hypothetical protein
MPIILAGARRKIVSRWKKGTTPTPPAVDNVLLENGDNVLLEDGSLILLEA